MTLVRAGFIPIPPGAKSGFDHTDLHRGGKRLYVAHTGADRIDVLDCEARTYLRALPPELPGVAGVLVDEEHDLLFSSDRGAASGWDPVDRCLYVFCPGSGGAAVYEERG